MVLYFTGTGNSFAVARGLAERLGDTCAPMLMAGESSEPSECSPRVLWVFPVHSWGVPPVVLAAIRHLVPDMPSSALHHMVATCGDDAGYTDRMWRRAVEARGGRTGSAFTVAMPNTYIDLPGFDVDPESVRRAKLSAMPARLDEIAASLRAGSVVTDVVRGAMPGLKTNVIYPLFMRCAIRPRAFAATDACVGCGECARVCPVGNVGLNRGRPEWGHKCTGCLACYHVCPARAVTHGLFSRGKGRYVHPDLHRHKK